MNIFGKAKQLTTRESFFTDRVQSRKYAEDQLAEMKSYILGHECVRDLERLESGDYFLDYPQYRLVPKGFESRKRPVYSFPGTQGFLLKLIVYAMRDLQRIYSDRLFSFRTDKNAVDLLLEVHHNREIQHLYVLKTDISNYVGSIVPELLIPMLYEVFMPEDPAFYRFLEWLLTRNRVIDHKGQVLEHCPGGMGGVPLGNFFMNLYLHELDEYFAPRAAFYSRFADDLLICARSEEEIREYKRRFFEFLDQLRLSVNPAKTEILMPGEAFDLLGMELSEGRIRISDYSMKKIKRKLRIYADRALVLRNRGIMTPEEAAEYLIIHFNRYFFGADGEGNLMACAKWAFPVITDTESLTEIDHYFQESVRYVLYGSMKKRKLSIPYEKLSALGYRTLVFYYYHPDRIQEIRRELPEITSLRD